MKIQSLKDILKFKRRGIFLRRERGITFIVELEPRSQFWFIIHSIISYEFFLCKYFYFKYVLHGESGLKG